MKKKENKTKPKY